MPFIDMYHSIFVRQNLATFRNAKMVASFLESEIPNFVEEHDNTLEFHPLLEIETFWALCNQENCRRLEEPKSLREYTTMGEFPE